jgi:4-aminobutyrate aminotransferase-like enzyme
MTLLDKLKTQEGNLAQRAQEAGDAGRAMLDQAEAKLKSHGLLRDLGAAVYAERSGDGSPENSREIDRLVGEIANHKAKNSSATEADDATASPGTSADGGPGKATS